MSPLVRIVPALLLLIGSAPAGAVDGAIEINQARALAGGVTPTDAPGFPVSLFLAGSYVLTGNLTVPDANTNGIEVLADNATIDFAGFGIYGPAYCVDNAGSVSCSNGGTGVGVLAATFPNEANGTVVKNGTISGMGNYGVQLLQRAHVDNMLIENCYGSPIQLEGNSLVTDSRILLSGGVGIYVPNGVVNIRGNRIAEIGGATHLGATEIGGNTCDDARCSATPTRRFYKTVGAVPANGVLSACHVGYHAATYHEIADPSALIYDWVLGHNLGDSGFGPTSGSAWARTGGSPQPTNAAGIGNCNAWTSTSSGDYGNAMALTGSTWTSPAEFTSPWSAGPAPCNINQRVWCVQD